MDWTGAEGGGVERPRGACEDAEGWAAAVGLCEGPGVRRRSFVTFSINRCDTPRNVSNTPRPSLATASNDGTLWGFSSAFSSSTEYTFGRSRLLYWITHGMESSVRPYSARFARRFASDSLFSSILPTSESATNTIASAPLSTSLRVAL